MSLWDRRKDETHPAYVAFCVYRDLGPDRTVDAASVRKSGKTGDAPGYWRDWCKKYNSLDRAHAYDEHIEGIQRAIFERELAKVARRRAQFELRSQDLYERAVERIDAVLLKADGAPITDVVQETTQSSEEPNSRKVIVEHKRTKVKGINFSGYARLWSQYCDIIALAIMGVRVDGDKKGPMRRKALLPEWMVETLRSRYAVASAATKLLESSNDDHGNAVDIQASPEC